MTQESGKKEEEEDPFQEERETVHDHEDWRE
jgi:hypothetical protein